MPEQEVCCVVHCGFVAQISYGASVKPRSVRHYLLCTNLVLTQAILHIAVCKLSIRTNFPNRLPEHTLSFSAFASIVELSSEKSLCMLCVQFFGPLSIANYATCFLLYTYCCECEQVLVVLYCLQKSINYAALWKPKASVSVSEASYSVFR